MAEGRMLKRRITASKKLARLKTDKARLLWFYMLPFTDVKGRLEADPEDIRDEIIRKQRKGFTIQRIIDCLNDLHNEGMIILYNSNGKQYLQYNRFADEQNLREDREAESKIPGPTTGEVQEQCGSSPPKVKLSKVKLSKVKLSEYSVGFEKFWKVYPRKTGKGAANEEWEKIKPSVELIEKIITSLEQQKTSKNWLKDDGQFIPHPRTWLHQRRWDDETPQQPKPVVKCGHCKKDIPPETPLIQVGNKCYCSSGCKKAAEGW